MKKVVILTSILLAALLLTSCAAGPNAMAGKPGPEGDVAGFWLGVWHGFISLFTFIVSLFNDNVSVYEVHNNGNWYNFGFIFGIMMFYGGSGGSGCRASRRR